MRFLFIQMQFATSGVKCFPNILQVPTLYIHTYEIIFARRAALYSEDCIAVNHLETTQLYQPE